jgi:hypothetical protein
MASVYARFRGSNGWEYQKVGRGRPPKDAKFHVRFTDAQGKRRWSQPFNTPRKRRKMPLALPWPHKRPRKA